MKITQMAKKHIPEVIETLSKAFNESALKRKGQTRNRKRKPEALLPYLEIDPKGCLVALEKNKVIGAIFGHIWGKCGWIGTFGVNPESQEKGIGKQLLHAIINHLDKQCNVTTLALETMSDSNPNIGLYSKLGFRPAFLTISLFRPIIDSPLKQIEFASFANKNNLEIACFSQEKNKEDSLTRCSWLASKIENGLDYSYDIKLIDKYNFGNTILMKQEGFIIGFAVCRTTPRYQSEDPTDAELTIKILVIDKDLKSPLYLDYLLYSCEKFGLENKKEQLRLNVNSSYWMVYSHLLNSGFRVRSSILRMIKFSEDIKSYDRQHEWLVNCSSLTM